MTFGQILFYSGIGLLGLTIILTIVFIIKKPKYTPESEAYSGLDEGQTQRLLNGYPTDPVTIRRDSSQEVVRQSEETEIMTDKSTELVSETERLSDLFDSESPSSVT